MKRFTLVVGTLLFTALLVPAQTKTDRERSGLAGFVKSVRRETAKILPNDGHPAEGARTFSSSETFDIAGKRTSSDFGFSRRFGAEHNKYDEKGRLVEITREKQPNLYLLPKTVLKYNDRDQLVAEIGYDGDGTMLGQRTYTYDSFGNRVEETSEPATSSKLYYNNYVRRMKYDEHNRRIEEATYKKVGDAWQPEDFRMGYYKRRFLLDSEGRKIGELTFSSDDKIHQSSTFVLTDRGNLLEWNIFNADGTTNKRTKYSYDTTDSQGNWVKQTRYEWSTVDGKAAFQPTDVTYQGIQYFTEAEIKAENMPPSPATQSEVLQNTDPEEYAVYDVLLKDWAGENQSTLLVISRFTSQQDFDDGSSGQAKAIDGVSKGISEKDHPIVTE